MLGDQRLLHRALTLATARRPAPGETGWPAPVR
jgi:hypothetical protein